MTGHFDRCRYVCCLEESRGEIGERNEIRHSPPARRPRARVTQLALAKRERHPVELEFLGSQRTRTPRRTLERLGKLFRSLSAGGSPPAPRRWSSHRHRSSHPGDVARWCRLITGHRFVPYCSRNSSVRAHFYSAQERLAESDKDYESQKRSITRDSCNTEANPFADSS